MGAGGPFFIGDFEVGEKEILLVEPWKAEFGQDRMWSWPTIWSQHDYSDYSP